MADVDVSHGPIPAGTSVTLADGRVARLTRALPAPPAGFRRCWWCCWGRLIVDDDEVEAEHRFTAAPSLADPARHFREREERLEADARSKAVESLGSTLTGDLYRMRF